MRGWLNSLFASALRRDNFCDCRSGVTSSRKLASSFKQLGARLKEANPSVLPVNSGRMGGYSPTTPRGQY